MSCLQGSLSHHRTPELRLRRVHGLPPAGADLAAVETDRGRGGIGLLDSLIGLREDHLDVARRRHVRVDLENCEVSEGISQKRNVKYRGDSTYTTVSTVGPSPLLGSLVHLDVLDDEVAGVETLDIGVGLGVLQEVEEVLGRLDGPAGHGDTELLACAERSVRRVFVWIGESVGSRLSRYI